MSTNKQTPEPKLSDVEMVANALNEQGFLFSQKVRELVMHGVRDEERQHFWDYVEAEYPVTASDGSQTRIDLVLRNKTERGVYACLECKRANPEYKTWIMFDKSVGAIDAKRSLFF